MEASVMKASEPFDQVVRVIQIRAEAERVAAGFASSEKG
jgi:hypothetical protein